LTDPFKYVQLLNVTTWIVLDCKEIQNLDPCHPLKKVTYQAELFPTLRTTLAPLHAFISTLG